MKTIRVKIPIAIGPHGKWNAVGWSGDDPERCMETAVDGLDDTEQSYIIHYIEADVPVPETTTIVGKIAGGTGDGDCA